MNNTQTDLRKRLLYILHLGLVEVRNLAAPENFRQIGDLADALEILPKMLDEGDHADVELIRFVLKSYEEKYPRRFFDYLKYLEEENPPEAY